MSTARRISYVFAVALVAALVFYVRGQAQSGTTPGTQPPGTIAIAAEKPVTKKQ
ncbi:MAG: hypothetical protein WAK33_23455 [Silvibacterium sp.]